MEKTQIGPGQPFAAIPPPFNTLYTLFYRKGNDPTCIKNFIYQGSLADASKRGQHHCELLGYEFIYVKPLVTNLDFDEQMRLRKLKDGSGSARAI